MDHMQMDSTDESGLVGVQTPIPVTKTLRELKEFSSNLGTPAASNGPSNAVTASAHNLLSRHGIRTEQFYSPLAFADDVKTKDGREGGGMLTKSAALAAKKFSGREAKDLDSYLKHHHELILADTLADIGNSSNEDFFVKMNDFIREDWEKEKEDLFRELAGYEGSSKMVMTQYTAVMNGSDTGNNNALQNTYSYVGKQSSIGGASYGFNEGLGAGTMLSDIGKSHAAIVARLNRGEMKGLETICSEFESAADSGAKNNFSSSKYVQSLRLVSDMIEGNRGSGKELISQRAAGALSNVCSQFRNKVVQRVRKLAMTEGGGSSLSPRGFAEDVAAYARAEIGLGGRSGLLWPQVYLCLRCGDAVAALQTLKSVSISDSKNVIEPFIINLLSLIANDQTSKGSMWAISSSNPDFEVLKRDVSELYSRYKATAASDESDRYKAAVLALISNADQVGRSSGVLHTVDDFIFSSLWYAVMNEENTVERISKMGMRFKKHGPNHFDQSGSTKGWGYAFPLLVAQQWGEALQHLANFGGSSGLLEATHLAICLFIGKAFGESALLGDRVIVEGGASNLMSMLLVNYSKSFQQTDPEAAVEYLVRIPDESGLLTRQTMCKEVKNQIKRLVLETLAFDVLAGKVSPDGTLEIGSKGALHEHFNQSEVKALLAETANDALKSRNVREAAGLLALSEKYGSLISLLCRELATHLVEGPGSEKRKFWYDTSLIFQRANLTSERKSRVLEVLEEEGMLNIGNAFQTLLNLTVFFDTYHQGKWLDASTIIDNLQIFPKTENEIIWKVNQFHSLDRVVQQVIPQVMLASMECLSELYAEVNARSRMASVSGQALSQRKEEVKNSANYMVIFAGKIPSVSSEIRGKIGSLEARLV